MTQRFITVAKELSNTHNLVILRCGQASGNTTFTASSEFKKFVDECGYFSEVIDDPGISSYNEIKTKKYKMNVEREYEKLDLSNVDCVIYDDSRNLASEKHLTDICRRHKIPTIANTHGNTSYKTTLKNLCKHGRDHFDKMFLFGRDDFARVGLNDSRFLLGGIPSNDVLKNYTNKDPKHILVVVCYALANQATFNVESGPIRFYNNGVMNSMRLHELQKKYDLPVLFKLKNRLNENMMNTVKIFSRAIPQGLKSKIVIDVDDENKMISESVCVLTYGSTMAFKSIQLDIPTIIFKELGFVGNFQSYPNTMKLDEFTIDKLDRVSDEERVEFLKRTIEGGHNFTSTDSYVESTYKVIKEKNV